MPESGMQEPHVPGPGSITCPRTGAGSRMIKLKSKKRGLNMNYESCQLCPRKCRVNRTQTTGYCKSGSAVKVARAALHMWEEPCISGANGSGTVFFSGCTLGCCFCQNYQISQEGFGKEISIRRCYMKGGSCYFSPASGSGRP